MSNVTKTLAIASSLIVGAIMLWEGRVTKPYYDVAGVLTDCYGNTYHVKESHIRTEAECVALLEHEIGRVGRIILKDNPNVPPQVLGAGISLVYNIGQGAYSRSTFRRKLIQGDWDGACESLKMWNKYTDPITKKLVVSKGLVNRRAEEYKLCMQR